MHLKFLRYKCLAIAICTIAVSCITKPEPMELPELHLITQESEVCGTWRGMETSTNTIEYLAFLTGNVVISADSTSSGGLKCEYGRYRFDSLGVVTVVSDISGEAIRLFDVKVTDTRLSYKKLYALWSGRLDTMECSMQRVKNIFDTTTAGRAISSLDQLLGTWKYRLGPADPEYYTIRSDSTVLIRAYHYDSLDRVEHYRLPSTGCWFEQNDLIITRNHPSRYGDQRVFHRLVRVDNMDTISGIDITSGYTAVSPEQLIGVWQVMDRQEFSQYFIFRPDSFLVYQREQIESCCRYWMTDSTTIMVRFNNCSKGLPVPVPSNIGQLSVWDYALGPVIFHNGDLLINWDPDYAYNYSIISRLRKISDNVDIVLHRGISSLQECSFILNSPACNGTITFGRIPNSNIGYFQPWYCRFIPSEGGCRDGTWENGLIQLPFIEPFTLTNIRGTSRILTASMVVKGDTVVAQLVPTADPNSQNIGYGRPVYSSADIVGKWETIHLLDWMRTMRFISFKSDFTLACSTASGPGTGTWRFYPGTNNMDFVRYQIDGQSSINSYKMRNLIIREKYLYFCSENNKGIILKKSDGVVPHGVTLGDIVGSWVSVR